MAEEKQKISVSFGSSCNVVNSQIGDQNQMIVSNQKINFPSSQEVNIEIQISKLKDELESLQLTSDIKECIHVLESEITLPDPNKNIIGDKLKQIMLYLGKKSVDVIVTKKLEATFILICAWLGPNWHSLMQFFPLK